VKHRIEVYYLVARGLHQSPILPPRTFLKGATVVVQSGLLRNDTYPELKAPHAPGANHPDAALGSPRDLAATALPGAGTSGEASARHPKGSPAKAPAEGRRCHRDTAERVPCLRGALNVPVWNFTFRTRKRSLSIRKPGFLASNSAPPTANQCRPSIRFSR